MDPSREDFAPAVGCRVGEYELLEVLGQGCFSIVYLGRASDGGHVALKLLRGKLGSHPEVFEEEKRGLEKARNAPHEARVVRLVSGWQEAALGNCYCLATSPVCSGGSLESLIEAGGAPPGLTTRLRWALEVAETLQLLHSAAGVRLYHGDVTARNVGLCPATDGEQRGRLEAYLLDLGVSMHNHPHGMTDPLKQQSASVAPEMEQGSRNYDESADVWSWSVLLYALLSWSLRRMVGEGDRAWFASLPRQARALWEHELQAPTAGRDEKERLEEVVRLMLDGMRAREERVGMETVVHVLRRALGYHEAMARLVWLDDELRPGGAMKPAAEARLRLKKAEEHEKAQQLVDQRLCLERAVRAARRGSGEADRVLLTDCLNNLAVWHHSRSEYGQAALLFEEVVAVRRAVLPPGDLQIAKALHNLASVYEGKGEYGRAMPLSEEALASHRAALPPEHLDIATCLDSLAGLYDQKGEYARALPLYEEALAIRRAASPPGHRRLAQILHNLAMVHKHLGDDDRALQLYEEALAIYRAALPPGHPHVATCLSSIAGLHVERGEYDRAVVLLEEALAMNRAALPPGHPHIATSLDSLAAVHRNRGEYDKALALREEALEICRSALPPGHPDVATCLNNAAAEHYSMGQYDEALALFVEALAIRRAALPPGHRRIAESLKNMATLHKKRGAHERALPLYEEALGMFRAALPRGHPDVTACLNLLATLHKDMGANDRAAPLYEEVLALRTASLPTGHHDIAAAARNLASVQADGKGNARTSDQEPTTEVQGA